MKIKFLFIAALSAISFCSVAQKVSEYGIAFSNVDQFGIVVKKGVGSGLIRFTALSMNVQKVKTERSSLFVSSADSEETDKSSGFGIALGYEYRIPLVNEFNIVVGPQLFYNYAKSKKEEATGADPTKYTANRLGLQIIIGASYTINEKICLSAEIFPGYTHQKSNNDIGGGEVTTTINSFSFNSSSAMLTLSYRLSR